MSGLWLLLWADAIATVLVFVFSLVYKNSSLYDPYWSVAPALLAFYWLGKGNDNLVGYLMLILILLWGIRLTYNWMRGWLGLSHEDWRYRMLREKNPHFYPLTNFAGIHLFPTIMVFLGMLPVYVVTAHSVNSLVSIPVLALGFIITLSAIFIELIADEQMRSFKKISNPEEFITSGLWKYSRHPNYFGEISFWLGLWVMQMSIVPSFWWTAIGFVAMLIMFLFASIPMMEAKNSKSKIGYKEYMKKVSVLIPFPYKR
ncbi:MAG: DUF1295 domain-containing protein [Bacteroidota bacterium]